MSVVGVDVTEQALLKNTEIDGLSYAKEIAGNRVYHFFEVPKLVCEVFVKGFGVGNAVLGSAFGVLDKLVKTEGLVFFAQDVLALPEKVSSFSNKTIAWWNNTASLKDFAHEGRKFVGHIGSTVGDYVDGCAALSGLGVNVSSVNKISGTVGTVGSALGAVSRITDYALDDVSSKPSHNLTPQLEQARRQILESRDLWNLSRDVSVLALSVLCLTVGFTNLYAVFSVGLPGVILGSRMAAYYRDLQIREIDASYAQMVAAKKVLKG